MRTYLIFKEKARCWNADPEIQALVKEIRAEDPGMAQAEGKYSAEKAAWLKDYAL
jgi:xylose isomerase